MLIDHRCIFLINLIQNNLFKIIKNSKNYTAREAHRWKQQQQRQQSQQQPQLS